MKLLEDAPQERFDRLRYIELKHGRICMLAVAGYLVTAAGVRLPGYCSFSADLKFADIPSGLAAFPALPGAGVIQIIGFILLLEMSMRDATGKSEFIGDYRNDYIDFGWYVLLFVAVNYCCRGRIVRSHLSCLRFIGTSLTKPPN